MLFDSLDFQVLHFVQSFANPLLDSLFKILTEFGSPFFWFFVVAFIYWQGKENQAFYLSNVVLLASAISIGLKELIARPRPDSEIFRALEEKWKASYSFPSGHATLAAAVYSYFSKAEKNWKALLLIGLVVTLYSRMYLGVHYLTDVLAGLILGLALGKVCLKLKEKWIEKHHRFTKLEDEVLIVVIVIVTLIALLLFSFSPSIGAFFGFYFGFFLFKEQELKQKRIDGIKQALPKAVIGFIGMTVILLPSILKLVTDEYVKFGLYFLLGFWVSFLFPWLYGKFRK